MPSSASPPVSHVMIDLETLGTAAGCVILSLGARKFDPIAGSVGEGYYATISLESAMDAGLTIDPATLKWWMSQSDAARAAAFKGEKPLATVLNEFTAWLKPDANQQIWSQGASFDEPILRCAYEKMKMKAPWKFWNIRDTRTIFEVTGVKVSSEGTKHTALDDATSQAKAVNEAYRQLGLAAVKPVASSGTAPDPVPPPQPRPHHPAPPSGPQG